jgi:hypothetical protein
MTPAEIDAILAKVAKEKAQKKLAQQRYKAKENVKQNNAAYMKEYRAKKLVEYNEALEALNLNSRTKKKEIIEDPKKVKVTCECGARVAHHGLLTHQKTKKHLYTISLNTLLDNNQSTDLVPTDA